MNIYNIHYYCYSLSSYLYWSYQAVVKFKWKVAWHLTEQFNTIWNIYALCIAMGNFLLIYSSILNYEAILGQRQPYLNSFWINDDNKTLAPMG